MADQGMFEAAQPAAEAVLAACRQRADAARHEIARATRALAGNGRSALSDRQRAQIGNMLRRLVAEIEATVHQELAAGLERREDLSRDAVTALASAPVGMVYDRLATSDRLLEPALVEAALHRMFEHMVEAALRPRLGDPWQGNRTIETMPALAAAGAADRTFADALEGYLVERAQRADSYGEPVLRMDELDDALVERLHWRVAAVLRARYGAAFAVAPESLDDDIQQAVRTALTVSGGRAGGGSAAMRAASALTAGDGIEGPLLLDTLRHAEMPLFLALLAARARLPLRLLRRLVFEPDGLGLAVAARASGLNADQLEAIFRLTRHARAPVRTGTPEDVRRLRAFFLRLETGTAAQVCEYWRLPAAYLDEIWRTGAVADGDRDAGHE